MEIARDILSQAVLARIFKCDPEEMYEDTLCYIGDALKCDGLTFELEAFEESIDRQFLNRYDSIRVFHSCRPIGGIESYRLNGIKPLSRDLLRELALQAFRDHRPTEIILEAVENEEIHGFEKGVYCFTDNKNPLRRHCSHYLQSGSEKLQKLSQELNLGWRGLLADQGSAYLIECVIPLSNVSMGFRAEMWKHFLTKSLKAFAGDTRKILPPDFCIRTINAIPPGDIVEFHAVDDSQIWSVAPRH